MMALCASLVLFSLTGCAKFLNGGGYIVDWSPVNVYLKIQDAAGTDLLDPDNPDNLIDGTSITFQGKTYEAQRSWYERASGKGPQTKAYLAQIYGLFLIQDKMIWNNAGDGFSLIFGEIDGAADLDEDLVVHLADGTEHTIHYHCSDHVEGENPSCKRSWKLDGVDVDSNLFTFVR